MLKKNLLLCAGIITKVKGLDKYMIFSLIPD